MYSTFALNSDGTVPTSPVVTIAVPPRPDEVRAVASDGGAAVRCNLLDTWDFGGGFHYDPAHARACSGKFGVDRFRPRDVVIVVTGDPETDDYGLIVEHVEGPDRWRMVRYSDGRAVRVEDHDATIHVVATEWVTGAISTAEQMLKAVQATDARYAD